MAPNLILHNARVYTVDPAQPWAEAVACKDGYIIAVGRNDEILSLADSNTQSINAQQKLVLPGLTDAHVHFLQYAIRQHQVNLFDVHDMAEVRHRLEQAVAEAQPGEWIQGWGWVEDHWDMLPHRRWLDEISPHNPIALARMDMHTWWVNSLTLNQVGVTIHTPSPPDSEIERDESGELTGILREWNAIRLVEEFIPLPDEFILKNWLCEAISQAHQLGLTGIHDQRVEQEGAQSLRLFQSLNSQEDLLLRVHHHIVDDFIDEVTSLGLQAGFGNDRLWLGHIKNFSDGTLGSRTALMLEPFEGETDNYGFIITPPERLAQLTWQANQARFPVSVHAIGDQAVRLAIEVLAEYPPEPTGFASAIPHRIEHVQLIHPDDMPILEAANIFASVQPVHLLTDWYVADKAWGKRSRYAYAFRSMLDHGVPLAFGSDAPVAPLNPMLGIYAAVTRQNEQHQPEEGWYPQERLTVAEAIEAYTRGPARLAGKEKWQGSITPGKWADMIMLSDNLFEIPPAELKDTTVDTTVFNGQIVYKKE